MARQIFHIGRAIFAQLEVVRWFLRKEQEQVYTCPSYDRTQSSETLTDNCVAWSQEQPASQDSHSRLRYTRC